MSGSWYFNQGPPTAGGFPQSGQWGQAAGLRQPRPQTGGGWASGGQWPGQLFVAPPTQPHPPMQGGYVGQQYYPTQYRGYAQGAQPHMFGPQQGQQYQQQHHQQQYQQQQQQQQQYQQQQARMLQERQRLYEEQQRRAKEEERQRELEIQKRRLQKIDVNNPVAVDPFQDLQKSTVSVGPAGSISSASTMSGEVPRSTSSSVEVVSVSPTPSRDSPAPAVTNTSQLADHRGGVVPGEGEGRGGGEVTSKDDGVSQQKATYEKLMAQSLSNLNQTGPKKQEFKTNTTPFAPRLPSQPSPKTALQSRKAREWVADAGEFSGLFAQHPPSMSQPEEDKFGEFQYTPVVPPAMAAFPGHTGREVVAQPSGSTTALFPLPQAMPLSSQRASNPATQHPLYQAPVPNQFLVSNVVQTSMPITATSISGPLLLTTVDNNRVLLGQDTRPTPLSSLLKPQSSLQASGGSSQSQAGLTPGTNVGNVATPPAPEGRRAMSPGGFSRLDMTRFPPIYHEVHRRCEVVGEDHVSTKELFPILLSSQLPRNVLKALWSLANRSAPGKLNKTELFVLLGLIALAQAGNPSPTLADLKKSPRPPIPTLTKIAPPALQPPPPPASVALVSVQRQPSDDEFGDFQSMGTAMPSFPLVTTGAQQPAHPVIPAQPVEPVQQVKPSELKDHSASLLLPAPPAVTGTRPIQPKPVKPVEPVIPVPIPKEPPLVPEGIKGGETEFTAFADFTAATQPQGTSARSWPQGTPAGSWPQGTSAGLWPQGTSVMAPAVPAGGVSVPTVGQVSHDLDALAALPSLGGVSTAIPSSQAAAAVGGVDSEGWADFASFGISTSPLPPLGVTSQSTATPPSATSLAQLGTITSSGFTKEGDKEKSAQAESGKETPLSFTARGLELLEEEIMANLSERTQPEPPVSVSSEPLVPEALTARGLELLEEEIVAKLSERTQPELPVGISSEPLVPKPAMAAAEDFGEFETYNSPGAKQRDEGGGDGAGQVNWPTSVKPQPRPHEIDRLRIVRAVLSKCVEVLEASVGVFSGVQEDGILREITGSEEGRNRLRGIVEVYRLSRRILHSPQMKATTNTTGIDVSTFSEAICQHWKALCRVLPDHVMEQLYGEFTHSSPGQDQREGDDEDVLLGSISVCVLCQMGKAISLSPADGQGEEYRLPLLFHHGQSYHAPCANFWTQIVQEKLPGLP